MIRKPNGSDAKRLGTGVLVAGVVAAGAIALAGPASAATTVSSLSISPKSQSTGESVCAPYTVTANNNDGTTTSGESIQVTVSGTTGATICSQGANGFVATPQVLTATGASGQTFYVASTNAGTVNIAVQDTATPSIATSGSLLVTTTTNDAVKSLTVNPTSATANAGSTVPFQVTALDTNNNPVDGATVVYQVGTTGTPAQACSGNTGTNGKVECDVPAGTSSSTVTFYVNNSSSTTAGRDAGEPQAQATLTVTAAPTASDLTLTCADQAANPVDDHTCTVPVGTSEKLTATVTYTDNNGTTTPVSGRQVNFSVTSPNGTVTPLTGTTDANGQVTATLTPSSSTAQETDTVEATSGALSDSDDVTFANAAATTLTLNPGSEDVTPKSTITETGKVTDQFGNPVSGQTLTVQVTSGPNAGQIATGVTTSTGSITLTYTDKTAVVGDTDNIKLSDSSANAPAAVTAEVDYVASTTASAVTLNFGDETATGCPTDTTDPGANNNNSNQASNNVNDAQEVCAQVTNNNGLTPLQGQSVTFTVNQGTVAASSAGSVASSAGKTVTVTTDSNGVALAYVSSTKSGAQTITAKTGGVSSNTLTDTRTPDYNDAFTLTLTPATATVPAGGTQKFTATETDKFGNGISNDQILFSQSGPGTINNTFGFTGTDGTASVLLTVPAGATGNGTVSATDDGFFGNSNNVVTSTYTVGSGVANVTAYLAKGASVGSTTDFASSIATDSNGKAVAGATLQFAITGSTTVTGTATTDTDGRATFRFVPQHAGALSVKVTSLDNTSATATASGSTAKGVATTQLVQVSPQKYRIRDTANVSVHKAGIQVDFYQKLASGANKYVGSANTDSSGSASFTIYHLKSGYVYKGIAKVAGGNADYTGPNSSTQSTTVK